MSDEKEPRFEKRAYAFKIKGRRNRLTCQSGGAFTALAEALIEKGWIIYGVAYEKPYAVYERIVEKVDLKRLRGSKYVQAKAKDVFQKLENDLKTNDRNVFFSGTPCMTAAAKRYCEARGIRTERLLTIEFLCHGVTSPKLFSYYLDYTEKQQGFTSKDFVFRDKTVNGWGGYYSKFKINRLTSKVSENWLLIYRADRYFRESCFNCKYASTQREADITISDFWSIRRTDKRFGDINGVSMILINSAKAAENISTFADRGGMLQVPLDSIIQPPMEHPTFYRDDGIDINWQRKSFGENARFIVEHYSRKDILLFCGIPLTLRGRFWKEFLSANIKSYFAVIKGLLR